MRSSLVKFPPAAPDPDEGTDEGAHGSTRQGPLQSQGQAQEESQGQGPAPDEGQERVPEQVHDRRSGRSVALPSEKKWARTGINTSPFDGFVFASSPTSAAAHRYRKMCAEIVSETWPRKVMLVTSPSAGDGKTITAVNLAFALAERQHSVLLVELALNRPRFRYVFGESPSGKGVESILSGNAYPSDVIGELGDSGIAIAGVHNASVADLLLSENPQLERFLKYSEKHYDWTVVDAPDVASSRAVQSLAAAIQPVIMVVRAHQTEVQSLQNAVRILDGHINFVIMNDERR